MSDLQQAAGYEFVTLVDRTGKGGREFIFDGVRFSFKPGKPKLNVPRFVAEWLFRVDQQKFNTLDGQYVCIYGVEDGPGDIMDTLGPEALDCSPIEIDEAAAEGWNAGETRSSAVKLATVQLKPRPSDFAHQGSGSGKSTFSAKERGAEP